MNFKPTVLIFFLILASTGFAGIHEDIQVDGQVVRFNTKSVWLYTRGQITRVPRASVKRHKRLKIGQMVSAYPKFLELKGAKKLQKRHGFPVYSNKK